MIHYNHNTNKHRNITLNKPKRHALPHYRHTQRIALIKDIATRALIVLTTTTILAAVYLVANYSHITSCKI